MLMPGWRVGVRRPSGVKMAVEDPSNSPVRGEKGELASSWWMLADADESTAMPLMVTSLMQRVLPVAAELYHG